MEKRILGQTTREDLERYKRIFAKKGYDTLMSAIKSGIELLEKTEKTLDRSKVNGQDLDGRSFEELYELAKENKIPGRSKMTKTELRKELKNKLYQ